VQLLHLELIENEQLLKCNTVTQQVHSSNYYVQTNGTPARSFTRCRVSSRPSGNCHTVVAGIGQRSTIAPESANCSAIDRLRPPHSNALTAIATIGIVDGDIIDRDVHTHRCAQTAGAVRNCWYARARRTCAETPAHARRDLLFPSCRAPNGTLALATCALHART
jgi:hypothetical protein